MIRWFASHPTAANLLLLLLIAAGLFVAPTLKRETFPDYRPTEVSIDVAYRGASAADVEDAICQRLHDAAKGVDYLDEFSCIAQDNIASSVATMKTGGNPLRFINELQTEINAIVDFPASAEDPIIRELHRSDLVAAIALTGDMPRRQLEDYALYLENKLLSVGGVAEVSVQGMSQRQWQIEVSREVLGQHGLSAKNLAFQISTQSIDLPLGILETPDRDLLLRFTDQRRSLSELASLIIVSERNGGELALGDIATLLETNEQPEEKILFNGERAIVLEVKKSLRDDSLSVKNSLEELITAETHEHDGLIGLSITQDMTSIVRDRLEMLVVNGIMGLALVVLVMSLFFRPRFAIWAVMGLPAAFMGAFVVMALTGLTLNMITLVALLMAIGIVMDDAIVITDNIAAHAQESSTALAAVIAGTRQVLPGVFSSFLTTVSVFAPLAYLSGELGAVLEVLPVVLIAALAASLIEAFWILPHHLRTSIAQDDNLRNSRFREYFDGMFEVFRENVGKLTDLAISFRYQLFGVMLAIILATAGFIAGGHIGNEAMPDIDGDVVEARLLMPQGTPLSHTESVAARIEHAMRRVGEKYRDLYPDSSPLIEAVQVRFNYNPTAQEAGTHVVTVIVDLLSAEQRNINLDELIIEWQEEIGQIPGMISLVIQEPGFGPAGIPVEIRLHGDDLLALDVASEELMNHLKTYTAVYNVTDDLHYGKPQRTFTLLEGAHSLGLTAQEVASQLRSAFLGEMVETQRIGDHDVEVLVRLSGADRNSLDDLADQTILLPDGNRVPIEVVAKQHEFSDWARITRIDGHRTVTVQANVDARLSSGQAIVESLSEQWLESFLKRHPGVELTFEGQVSRSSETGGSIGRGLMIGLLGIFVILSFQFRSYVEPLIVMLSIPLAFTGALWGHVLMGYYISMPSLIGAASLAGIVVNNAILLIHFIKVRRRQGADVLTAAGQASRDRLRAILISSSTTIAGLLPLLAETSTQAAAIKPLVISVVFGLLSATVLVIAVIPALYVLIHDLGWTSDTEERELSSE
ncbi:efflux RND transporter permease subunit [Lacimicrobium alkaliphilum]|uniref:Acriflavin resistance protein n=1 Tax=Lacimicrobium alkaliphilum TaxID=1526571 RepID=A0A0U2ZBL0_9ALTE|nr:efflux RND transporter permease subunit [Lacimicrobium alkaliphilum]ALS99860.1 acriflavin resistance protein [Lacimicrobium alkaliphilum]